MDALLNEFTHDTATPWQIMLARLLIAALFGAALGFERELSARAAGLRTHMLVSLASASFALIALEVVAMPIFNNDHVRADPMRLVEAITSGVAFLAAGFIVFKRGNVRGLTTGAGMWLASAVGLATGLGIWPLALLCCLLGVCVVVLIRRLETKFELKDKEQGHPPLLPEDDSEA